MTKRLRGAVRVGAIVALLLTLGRLSVGWAQIANSPRDDFWVPDGDVKTVVATNGVLYLGGRFDYVGPNTETGIAFDLVSGLALFDGFPKFAGAIKVILSDGAGGWFVGGQFTAVEGQPYTNLVHILPGNRIDPGWQPNPDATVQALASDGTRLFVGGSFQMIGGKPRAALAALTLVSGEAIEGWRADLRQTGFGYVPEVATLLVWQNLLFVGGNFASINDVPREHLASVELATGAVTGWYPNGYVIQAVPWRVTSMGVYGDSLYIGGTFQKFWAFGSVGTTRNYAAAMRVVGTNTIILPWHPNADGPVSSLVVTCDGVILAGAFRNVGAAPVARNRLAMVDLFSGNPLPWNPNANNDVSSLLLHGDVLYVGGKFSQMGGQPRTFLAAVELATGLPTEWSPRADFDVTALAVAGGAVITGGQLGPGGKLRRNIAALDQRTGQLLDWAPQIGDGSRLSNTTGSDVNTMVVSPTAVYIGGQFTNVNGRLRNHLAALHPQTGELLENWNPNANGLVRTLTLADGLVYVGGAFFSIGNRARLGVAAVDASTGIPTDWDPSAGVTSLSVIESIARVGDTVYVAGSFTRIGGQTRRHLAALDAVSGLARTNFNPNPGAAVNSCVPHGPNLYFGGSFATVTSQARSNLAAVSLVTGALQPWSPNPVWFDAAGARSASVNVVLPYGSNIMIGGSFSSVRGTPRPYLAELMTNGLGAATAWNPILDDSVDAMAVGAGGTVYAAGVFNRAGGAYRPHLAAFPPVGSPVFTLQPASRIVLPGETIGLDAAVAGQAPLVFQWQKDGTNLPGATGPSLALSAIQIEHGGDYVLVVTNALGMMRSRPAIVTVVQPVQILTEPQSELVNPGATATLSVVAAGRPAPRYQWRRNGVNIAGATRSTLTVTNAQTTDGGSFEVIVHNLLGAASSRVVTVIVNSPAQGLANDFAARPRMTTASGFARTNSLSAFNEAGEPRHAGIRGGRSVWMNWVAPNNGIATFSTRGSAFDTALAVYTGNRLDALRPEAQDEDRGGFYNSRVSFNAVAGVEYAIAIDGFSAQGGNVVLGWTLETGSSVIPVFIVEPVSLVRTQLQSAAFFVQVSSATAVTYQWYRGCLPIPGATSAAYSVANVRPQDIGGYRVVVANLAGRTAESVVAELEIGPVPGLLSQDKIEDAPPGEAGLNPSTSPGFISLAVGTINQQLFNNTRSATSTGEPLPCGSLGGSSVFFDFRTLQPGVVVMDTLGSQIDTLMVVYYKTNFLNLSNNRVDCDDNSAPDGIRSKVRFAASGVRDYRVYVDGVGGVKGALQLNWRMGLAPRLLASPIQSTNAVGSSLQLRAESDTNFPPARIQWYRNGAILTGATNTNLILPMLQSGAGGVYSVLLENEFGTTTATVAVVTIANPTLPYLTVEPRPPAGVFRVWLQGPSGQRFQISRSADLTNWVIWQTNIAASPPQPIDFQKGNTLWQYLRAQPLP